MNILRCKPKSLIGDDDDDDDDDDDILFMLSNIIRYMHGTTKHEKETRHNDEC